MDLLSLGLFLPALGLAAGALTTVAGMGGGISLVLALSLLSDPATALAACAPALLVGNAHRLAAHIDHVDRRIALAVSSGALPGSVAGGFLAAALPTAWLQALLFVGTALAVLRALGLLKLTAPSSALVPAGFGIGAASATTSGAGLLMGPLLMASGLTGEAYIATGAFVSIAMHVGRLFAYGASGLLSSATLVIAGILMVSILGGNVLGERIRKRITPKVGARIELATLVGCVALALLGLHS
jgi:uncharacterized membrane protein YfcA